jgi:hypothetical protein
MSQKFELFKKELADEKTRHEKEMERLLDKLEKGVVSQLKKRGNFMILPHDEDITVCIVDGAGRNTTYYVYAVGLTTDDHVIYVTGEALYHEWDCKYDMDKKMQDENGFWTEEFVKKSDYWWTFEDNVRKFNVRINKENVLMNVYRIIEEMEK